MPAETLNSVYILFRSDGSEQFPMYRTSDGGAAVMVFGTPEAAQRFAEVKLKAREWRVDHMTGQDFAIWLRESALTNGLTELAVDPDPSTSDESARVIPISSFLAAMGPGRRAALAEVEATTLQLSQSVAQLPQWAQVAFAARCARRVQPLFTAGWPAAPGGHINAVDKAIKLAELTAAQAGNTNAWLSDAASDAYSAPQAASGANAKPFAVDAADAAGTAADAAAARFNHVAAAVSHAILAALRAASSFINAAGDDTTSNGFYSQVRRDQKTLSQLATREGWTDDTAVTPSVFGPMWPEGPPPGWPVEPTAGQVVAEARLPTEEEIEALPRWARVAFAARCVRRMLPCVQDLWSRTEYKTPGSFPLSPGTEPLLAQYMELLKNGTQLAELSAGSRQSREYPQLITNITRVSSDLVGRGAVSGRYAYNAFVSAGKAVTAALGAISNHASDAFRALMGAEGAILSVERYWRPHTSADDRWPFPTRSAIRRDFDALLQRAIAEGWSDSTAVPPDVFGPLWPNGPPPGWPEDKDTELAPPPTFADEPAPPLSLLFEVGVFTPFEVAEVIALLGDLYHAVSGDELIIDSTDTFDPALAPVPEGGLR